MANGGVGGKLRGGGDTTTLPGGLPDTPSGDGGYGRSSSPGDPPPREALGPARQESICTTTAHEGAPGRGDGPGSPRGGEPARAVARGPTPEWGGGGMVGGTAAAALRLLLAAGVTGTAARDSAPPPPPLGS